MTFDEHVRRHTTGKGEVDLNAAERARAAELAATPEIVAELAAKAARDERRQWESQNSGKLRKQFAGGFEQLTLGGLDLDLFVQLGENVAVRLGEMNEERIRIREDLRTDFHLKEARAYDAEMTFWRNARRMLPPGGTIGDIS
jgi:hypothetical protein